MGLRGEDYFIVDFYCTNLHLILTLTLSWFVVLISSLSLFLSDRTLFNEVANSHHSWLYEASIVVERDYQTTHFFSGFILDP